MQELSDGPREAVDIDIKGSILKNENQKNILACMMNFPDNQKLTLSLLLVKNMFY